MCELLWSDPKPAEGRGPSQRGVGVGFGPDVTRNFLQDNKLDLLVRSHEVNTPSHLLVSLVVTTHQSQRQLMLRRVSSYPD